MRLLKLLGYIWALPHTTVGLLLMIYYGWTKVEWRDGCLEVVAKRQLLGGPWVAGQTHGWLIFFRNEQDQANGPLSVHERVHVLQGMIGGVFFVIAYVLNFLVNMLIFELDFKKAYYEIYFEKKAYAKDYEYELARRVTSKDETRYWGHR